MDAFYEWYVGVDRSHPDDPLFRSTELLNRLRDASGDDSNDVRLTKFHASSDCMLAAASICSDLAVTDLWTKANKLDILNKLMLLSVWSPNYEPPTDEISAFVREVIPNLSISNDLGGNETLLFLKLLPECSEIWKQVRIDAFGVLHQFCTEFEIPHRDPRTLTSYLSLIRRAKKIMDKRAAKWHTEQERRCMGKG